ncbi:ABC transporter ATP-binding protein [Methylobacillus flagellatus]|uniref:ABC transporter related protein n=1 Tax=Methylobacillus flagellatus (strain ATCC 51484 / DSM 6875 / VKM B-1610 / KT) TaxID=265072 RepID=Q1H3G4_METFK|nr:ATP-binding cassette domain-containing protein [Methylobacillus flagellatus]ABE48973.1 ABC transporter related protein [Methylobacillus flagellatus KT]
MASPAIHLENLQFEWTSGRPCLDIASLDVMPGERIFLHGPSGSGKSTLLGLLGGMHLPQTGIIDILSQRLDTLNGAARDRFRADHIGFLFQQFNLIPYLSVLDNVLLPCRFSAYRRNNIAGNVEQEAQRLLAALRIDATLGHRKVTTLSIGQQQRVAAARALIGRPEIIIADEPTSALDASHQQAFIDLLMQECLASASALIFVSHDHRLATSFDRSIALAELNRVSVKVPE